MVHKVESPRDGQCTDTREHLTRVRLSARACSVAAIKVGARVNVLPTIWVDNLKEAGQQKNLDVAGYKAQRSGEDMARVLQLVADGKLTLIIQQVYPLSEVVTAHHALQKGDAFGKIVLKVD